MKVVHDVNVVISILVTAGMLGVKVAQFTNGICRVTTPAKAGVKLEQLTKLDNTTLSRLLAERPKVVAVAKGPNDMYTKLASVGEKVVLVVKLKAVIRTKLAKVELKVVNVVAEVVKLTKFANVGPNVPVI